MDRFGKWAFALALFSIALGATALAVVLTSQPQPPASTQAFTEAEQAQRIQDARKREQQDAELRKAQSDEQMKEAEGNIKRGEDYMKSHGIN